MFLGPWRELGFLSGQVPSFLSSLLPCCPQSSGPREPGMLSQLLVLSHAVRAGQRCGYPRNKDTFLLPRAHNNRGMDSPQPPSLRTLPLRT